MSMYTEDPEKKEGSQADDTRTIRVQRHLWPEEVELIETKKKLRSSRIIGAVFAAVTLIMGWLLGSILPWSKLGPIQQILAPVQVMDTSDKISAILTVMERDWYFGQEIDELHTRLIDQALYGITGNEEDPHTEYMSAEEVEAFTQSINRNFVGIGIQFLSDNGINIVEKVFKDSPAEKAGVLSGDIIHTIDGKPADGLDTQEIKDLVMGDEGTDVTIEFLRQGEPVVITITRGKISATTFGRILEDGTGYLELYQFGEGTANEVRAYFNDFRDKGVTKLVIDLRNNGGGYLNALSEIASCLLPQKTLVMKQEYASGETTEIRAGKGMYTCFDGIVILVNENTASASEVLTMALKEQREDVTVIGTKTYGKGTVQVTRAFKDGSALKYTTSKWLSPSGVWVNRQGIEPDETVRLHDVLYRTFAGIEEEETWHQDQVSEAVKDAQLCLDYLGMNAGRTDGYYSVQTEEAIRQFQNEYGLAADGVLNSMTYKALISAVQRDWAMTDTHDTQLKRAQEILHG